jgi:hypothetical protein
MHSDANAPIQSNVINQTLIMLSITLAPNPLWVISFYIVGFELSPPRANSGDQTGSLY